MIPELISKKHIDVALSTILREGVPSRRMGRDYCVVVDVLESFLILDDENEREVLTICAETLFDQESGAAIMERLKPPTTAKPTDLDWLDNVMIGFPDDLLTECEME